MPAPISTAIQMAIAEQASPEDLRCQDSLFMLDYEKRSQDTYRRLFGQDKLPG